MVTEKQKNYLDVVWDRTTLGSMISALRQCDGIRQIELAKKLGVSKQFLSNLENNKKKVGVKFALKISEVLNYPVEPFLELIVRDQMIKEGLNVEVKITASS